MIQEKNDLYKEVFTILAYFNDNLINKIPDNILNKIKDLAANSDSYFYIDKEKSLKNQEISEESKDLISLIYYNYIANEEEKREIWKIWNENEDKIREELRRKYNSNNLFRHKIKENSKSENTASLDMAMVEYKKENLFLKIKNIIKKILKK